MSKQLLLIGFLFSVLVSCKSNYFTNLRNGVALPKIALPNTIGDTIDVKNLKGKLVLVEFWASWCGPCRKRHPQVDEIYKKYKKAEFETAQGFEIYAVSMDTESDVWLKSIQKEKLSNWSHHVSDLQGMGGKIAPRFQFTQIPTSYLINENGIIVGKDLKPEHLDFELKMRLKNR